MIRSDELIERLRESAKAYRGMLHDSHANDCEEAADRIEALTRSNDEPTEAMIEAGIGFVCGADHTFGKTQDNQVSLQVLRQDVADLYTAMRSAS